MVYILRSSSGFFVLGSNPGPVLSGQPCSMAVKFLKRKFLLNLSPPVDDHIDKIEEDLCEHYWTLMNVMDLLRMMRLRAVVYQ